MGLGFPGGPYILLSHSHYRGTTTGSWVHVSWGSDGTAIVTYNLVLGTGDTLLSLLKLHLSHIVSSCLSSLYWSAARLLLSVISSLEVLLCLFVALLFPKLLIPSLLSVSLSWEGISMGYYAIYSTLPSPVNRSIYDTCIICVWLLLSITFQIHRLLLL